MMAPSSLPIAALLLAACAADPATTPPSPSLPAGPGPAWPTVLAEAAAPAGYTWQTLRHQTVHARLLVPDNAEVSTENDEATKTPSLRVTWRGLAATLTFSPTSAWVLPGLAATPPHALGAHASGVRRSPDTVAWQTEADGGGLRVTAVARGVQCVVELGPFDRAAIDAAYTVCGSVRPPAPGPWGPTAARSNGTAVPAGAWAEPDRGEFVGDSLLGPYAPRIYAGWFGLAHTVCPADYDTLGATVESEVEATVSRHDTAAGPAYVRQARAEREGVVFDSGARVVAPRGDGCCIAELFPMGAPPSDAEVDYIVALCDTTG